MKSISIFAAKAQFSALLDQVERGTEIVVTRRGKPIARLVPVRDRDSARAAAADLLEMRQSLEDQGVSFTWAELKAMRDEGRR